MNTTIALRTFGCATLLTALGLGACAEVRDDERDVAMAPREASVDAAADAPRSEVVSAPDAAGNDAGATRVVLNELRASGTEFVELYNTGSVAADLGGFALTDTVTDGGAPNFAEAVRFPAGTSVPGGGYLVVRTKVTGAMPGPQTDCADLGVSSCFHASWGVSNSRGETVFLLRGGDVVTERAEYPPMGAASSQSWGRLPNGTGDFAVGRPTPGGQNSAP